MDVFRSEVSDFKSNVWVSDLKIRFQISRWQFLNHSPKQFTADQKALSDDRFQTNDLHFRKSTFPGNAFTH